jgi:hypothetical protein
VKGSMVTRNVLYEVAEFIKVYLNTPTDPNAPESYPDAVQVDGRLKNDWQELCAYHGFEKGMNALTCSAESVADLFDPALTGIVGMVAGICRLPARPVQALCLTGNASRLRAFQSQTANIFLERLPDDAFDRHPSRIFRARDPKLAVSKGAFAVFCAQAQDRNWVWDCEGMLDTLPYEIGRMHASGAFEVLVKRGTKLPFEMAPPHQPRELTLFKRVYIGDQPASLGTLSFEAGGSGKSAAICIDRERQIFNQYGLPITPPPPRMHALKVPLLSELGENRQGADLLHW